MLSKPFKRALSALGVLAGVLCGSVAATAPRLLVNGNGLLTGANGVDVNGTLYDVTFQEGSCVALFSGCDSAADFAFGTDVAASAASSALLPSR